MNERIVWSMKHEKYVSFPRGHGHQMSSQKTFYRNVRSRKATIKLERTFFF